MTLHRMAEKIAFFLVKKEIVKQEQIEIYSYGLEVLIASVLNGLIILLAGLFLGVFWQTVLMLIPFIIIRKNGGGFHARSHLGCMLGFLFVYLLMIAVIKNIPLLSSQLVLYALISLSTMIIILIGAVRHENRPVTSDEYGSFKRRTRLLTAVLTLVGLIGIAFAPKWFSFYVLGIFNAATSMFVAWINIKWKGEGL